MAKPTNPPPRWGLTALDVDAANLAEPSSGQKDTGWTPSQLADSSFDNWAKAWTYRWLKYLADGAFEDAITFADGVTFNDNITLTSPAIIIRTGLSRSWGAFGGQFRAPGIGNVPGSGDIDYVTMDTIGGSYRIPMHGMEPGDKITSFAIAWDGVGSIPTLELHYECHGIAAVTLACTAGTAGTINGQKIQRYTVTSPVALGSIAAIAPDTFTQRAAVKVTATSANTQLFGVTANYDQTTPHVTITSA